MTRARVHATGWFYHSVLCTPNANSAVIRVNERREKEEGGRRRGHRSCGGLIKTSAHHPINATTLQGWHATNLGPPMRGMAAAGNYKSSINKRNSYQSCLVLSGILWECELLLEEFGDNFRVPFLEPRSRLISKGSREWNGNWKKKKKRGSGGREKWWFPDLRM